MKGKKLKKWLSGIAAMAMLVTAMTVNVAAAPEGDTGIDKAQKTGTLTVTQNQEGKTASVYTAYKVLDAIVPEDGQDVYNYEWTEEFTDFPDVSGLDLEKIDDFINGPDDYVVGGADTADTLGTALQKYISDNPDIFAGKGTEFKFDAENLSISRQLDIGYYVIVETESTANYIKAKPILVGVPNRTADSGVGSEYVYEVNVTIKDQPIGISKTIEEAEADIRDSISEQVGKEYTFKVTSTVPDYNENYQNITYKVTDTMSQGITLLPETVQVIGVKDGKTTELTFGEDYTISVSAVEGSGTVLTIDFSEYFENIRDYDSVIITYKGMLNKDAVVGVNGNLNTAELEYTTTPGGETGKTEDKAKTYTGGLKLTKVDSAGNTLEGAEFTVYESKVDDSGNVVIDETKPAALITYKVDSNGNITAERNDELSATATTGPDGVIRFDGLGEGTYFIKEIKAPSGYIILKNPIRVDVEVDLPGSITDGTETATFKYTITGDGTELTITDDGIAQINVENSKGFTLPTTGGAGTYLFTIGGAILMLAAASVFIISRRKANTK